MPLSTGFAKKGGHIIQKPLDEISMRWLEWQEGLEETYLVSILSLWVGFSRLLGECSPDIEPEAEHTRRILAAFTLFGFWNVPLPVMAFLPTLVEVLMSEDRYYLLG